MTILDDDPTMETEKRRDLRTYDINNGMSFKATIAREEVKGKKRNRSTAGFHDFQLQPLAHNCPIMAARTQAIKHALRNSRRAFLCAPESR